MPLTDEDSRMLRATTISLLATVSSFAGPLLADDLPPGPAGGPATLDGHGGFDDGGYDVHPLATPGDYGPGPGYAAPLPYRSSELAVDPHCGDYSPSRGYLHYDCPSQHYGLWHRPSSFGRGPGERCAPQMWNPRGYGNLFAESSEPYRMDYTPYVLHDPCSKEGPAYHPTVREYCCCSPLLLGSCRTRTCCWLTRLFCR